MTTEASVGTDLMSKDAVRKTKATASLYQIQGNPSFKRIGGNKDSFSVKDGHIGKPFRTSIENVSGKS